MGPVASRLLKRCSASVALDAAGRTCRMILRHRHVHSIAPSPCLSSSLLTALALTALPATARAQEAAPPPSLEPTPPPAYSLPWQLRPAAATTSVRLDTDFAKYEDAKSNGGFTVASVLSASYKIPGTGDKWAGLAPILRLTAVNDSPPSSVTTGGAFAVVNPLVGATYAVPLGEEGGRLALFLGATIPIGMGGGNTPDKGVTDARSAGQFARSQMDDSLFAVNDVALIPGVDLAWVHAGLTLQAEATLFQLWRVRGAEAQPEATKTNFTSGVHVGYYLTPFLSLGLDVRYQRWLNAPIAVDHDATGTKIDNWTAALGPRLHIPLGKTVKIHPGLAYARGLDKPMAASTPNYDIVQFDIPVTF
jgi:hypothetical protein